MTWSDILKDEKEKPYFARLKSLLTLDNICPRKEDVFRAFALSGFDEIKVVILGQDPYHTPGVADGLAFSTRDSKIPPSLGNIFKEIEKEYGYLNTKSDLTGWAKQGVLLLNTSLTTLIHQPLAHNNLGWETFTDMVISQISKFKEHVVFMLWGNHAKSKLPLIDTSKHLVLTAGHPSPLSARLFLSNGHFKKANQYLTKYNIQPIVWTQED
jgi:uracil-DNA glycosylase